MPQGRAGRLLAVLPLGVLWVAGDGRIRYANAAAGALLRRATGITQGRDLASVLASLSSHASTLPTHTRAPFTMQLVCDRLPMAQRASAESLEVSGTPLPGGRHDLLVTLRAVQRGSPADADDAYEDLLLLLSHELRSPLAYISASAELLQDDDVDGQLRQQMLAEIHSQANRLARLLEHILDAERLSSGRARVETRSLAPRHLVDGVLGASSGYHAQHRIDVQVGQGLPLVRADSVRTGIVLRNLLENACKYAPRDTVITVSAEDQGSHVRISVRDEGPGIPVERLDVLFQRFRRAGSGQGGLASGYGLGLYISKTLVEAQGGAIGAQSQEGEGSLFWFTLPKCDPEDGLDE